MATLATQARRRHAERARRAAGISFVEVLIITAIVGLLTALTIPSFLDTRGRASEVTAESLLRTGATAMESAAVEVGGYEGLTAAALQVEEPAATWMTAKGAQADDAQVTLTEVGPDGYTLATTTPSGTTYVLERDLSAATAVTRTCGPGCTW